MLILKIVLLLAGLGFTLFGYFILFKKKYHLINGFTEEYKAGIKDEFYARRVGKVELMLGIVLLSAGVLLTVFK